MAISETTRITCDYVDPKTGKQCSKVFLIPDPPAKPTPGWENVLRLVNVEGGKSALSFCSMLHLVAFGVSYLKATPKEESVKQTKVIEPTAEQIETLTKAGLIEPGSGLIAPPEDLNLKD